MKFHICTIEPQGYQWAYMLDDGCRLFCYALESLGHSCSMGLNQLEPDRINIIFCGHLLVARENVQAIAQGCRYIAIQHEILAPGGINQHGTPEHFEQVYLPFLRNAVAVWEGIPRNLPPLRNLGLQPAFFRGGHHPWMNEIHPRREQDIDFLFYGSITPYRRQMLERLAERGHRIVAVFDARPAYRNDLISRAKVHLAPIQGPGMEHFAYGRVGYLLNNNGLVVVERCQGQEWLEHCFVTAPTEHWVDVCEQTLARRDRDEIRREFAARYERIPFVDQVAHLLKATFGGAAVGGHAIPPCHVPLGSHGAGALGTVAASSTGATAAER